MRRILTASACVALFAGLALAETFTGKLIDASCAQQQQSANSCIPNASTTAYAIDVSGKVYQLDADGNAKAAEALKSRADRMAEPNGPAKTDQVRARVKGTLEGGTLKVDSIEVQ
jgi:hypothetical protein